MSPISGQITAAPHNSNYAALQNAINNLLTILAGGSSGQVLFGNGTTLTWAPATATAPTVIRTVGWATTALAWAANLAMLAPIEGIVTPTTITRIAFNLGVSSGNIDVGIYYTDDEVTWTRYFSTGSFASPGTGMQTKSIAAQTITPVTGRRWYFAIAADNGTITVNADGVMRLGVQKAASFVLPASITAVTAGVQGPAIVGLV